MHHKLSFRRKLQAFFLSLLLVLLTAAGVPSAAYTAEAASADTTMAEIYSATLFGISTTDVISAAMNSTG